MKLRQAKLDDHAAIMALNERTGMSRVPEALWRGLWVGNPLVESGLDWPIGWVLEDGERVAGFYQNVPMAYVFEGAPLVGSISSSWTVDPDVRFHSLGCRFDHDLKGFGSFAKPVEPGQEHGVLKTSANVLRLHFQEALEGGPGLL